MRLAGLWFNTVRLILALWTVIRLLVRLATCMHLAWLRLAVLLQEHLVACLGWELPILAVVGGALTFHVGYSRSGYYKNATLHFNLI